MLLRESTLLAYINGSVWDLNGLHVIILTKLASTSKSLFNTAG